MTITKNDAQNILICIERAGFKGSEIDVISELKSRVTTFLREETEKEVVAKKVAEDMSTEKAPDQEAPTEDGGKTH